MGVALFIVPEREVEGLDTFVDGKALAHVENLDDLALAAGVRPLMEFFSASPDDFLGVLGEEGDDGELHLPEGTESPPVEWFDAESGLATVRGPDRLPVVPTLGGSKEPTHRPSGPIPIRSSRTCGTSEEVRPVEKTSRPGRVSAGTSASTSDESAKVVRSEHS